MNILHVIPDLALDSGGPVTAVLGMAEAQSKMGHSVVIVATRYGNSAPPTVEYAQVYLYPCEFSKWRWSSALRNNLYSHIGDADLVHLHTLWSFPVLAAASVCAELGKPYILRPCGMLDPWSLSQKSWLKKFYLRLFQKKIISPAAAIHFTSESEQLNSAPYTKGVHDFVCPIGITAESKGNHQALKANLMILFLSRLHYKKKPEVVIQAFGQIAQTNPNLRLIMAGSGKESYVRKLQRMVQKLGLNDQVSFPGLLTGSWKEEVLSGADLFVLPSLHENFGISVVEAMAAGCPVVISDRINIAGEISRAQAGIVCLPETNNVARAMAKLIESPKLRKEMGENGKKLFHDQYESSIVMKSLLGEYDRLLDLDRKAEKVTV